MNNYHTHTFRCSHANGDERAMVEAAIQEGYQQLGFSEHVPLPCFRWHLIKALPFSITGVWSTLSWCKAFLLNGPGMRMPYKEKKVHLNTLSQLQEEYQDKIQIYKGFECEYLEEYLPYYRRMLESKEVDYLIFGHHFHKYAVGRFYYGKYVVQFEEIQKYVAEAKKGLSTGLFTYFAHPDLFMNGYHAWNDDVEKLVEELCMCAKENDIPLELNAGGIKRKQIEINGQMCYPYPNYYFWEVASRIGCKAIIGMDAHDPQHLNKEEYELLKEFANELDLQLITTLF